MSVPPALQTVPPLPLGWTEHIAPSGQLYYFHSQTQESTYSRPLPNIPSYANLPPPQAQPPKKKKDKPLVKTPIPGTDWIRVKTIEGNVFYSHKNKKESFWQIPDDIKDAVESLVKEEQAKQEQSEKDALAKQEAEARAAEQEQLLEIERIKNEVQAMAMIKRKAEDFSPLQEVITTKKPRIEEEEEENEENDSDESEEEEWQREAAAQLAAEAEEEKKRVEAEAERAKEEAKEAERRTQEAQINMPDRVDLSVDEAKALFKTLLREKDINPLHPWDKSLPLFISDPRYVLLKSVSVRREAFDEYCRDRARELRQTEVKKEKSAANPKEEFERLLREEVKSTRNTWSDFRRLWKKDRRFYNWGRDDREREKRFRDFLKELGEKKRAAVQKAEADFFLLLKEREVGKEGSIWREVKRKLSDDPRYDAVGSSSLRKELFNTFLKGNMSTTSTHESPRTRHRETSEDREMIELDDEEQRRRQKERKERAVREREEKVRTDRGRMEAELGRSKSLLNKEEGEMQFKSMLTDAIRDPQVTWDAALPQLKTDPRFRNSPLPVNHQLHLFHTHVGHLRSKHYDSLHVLFESHAPSLATSFDSLPLSSLMASLPVTKLGLDTKTLEHEFDKWQRERTSQSRMAFDTMLTENAFVEFWGRLGKIGGEGVDGGVKADETEEDEGEGGGGKVDMKVLAKNVDVTEMEKVLKNDKRYIMFDHVPDQRERWIRDYLARLAAPQLSVHVPTSS